MHAPARRLVPCLAVALGIAFPADAALGAKQASVNADVSHFKARLKSTNAGTYAVHELTQDGGAVTREFTNGAGTVFAVAWQGPARPDLRQLFGDYFPRFQADVHNAGRFHLRRAMRADDIDFVVRTGGHPGSMWGYAVLPDQIPQGFPPEALQ